MATESLFSSSHLLFADQYSPICISIKAANLPKGVIPHNVICVVVFKVFAKGPIDDKS